MMFIRPRAKEKVTFTKAERSKKDGREQNPNRFIS